ncbi:MAG: signal peptidase II [Candidatus Brocadiae bacterium]|nr:signal peptidase II [Candidatus Brocadiia bacterium]
MAFAHTLVEGKRKLLWPIAGGVVALDQVTKVFLAHSPDDGRGPIVLIPHVLQLVSHPGNVRGIFGRGPASEVFYICASVVGLVIVGMFFLTTPAHRGLVHAALGLLAGGAVGNFIDRAALGAVRDFIDLHWGEAFHWYTFNVADAAICVGFGLILWDVIFFKDRGSAAAGVEVEERDNA